MTDPLDPALPPSGDGTDPAPAWPEASSSSRTACPSGEKIRVVAVDDDLPFHQLLNAAWAASEELVLLEPCLTGAEALAKIPNLRPDVVLMDLKLPDLPGIEVISRLIEIMPGLPVVVVTGAALEDQVALALRAGAYGFVCKLDGPAVMATVIVKAFRRQPQLSPPALGDLVATIHQEGGSMKEKRLTPRQKEVYDLLVQGNDTKEIAIALNITVRTVESHLEEIYKKLGAHTAEEARARYWPLEPPADG